MLARELIKRFVVPQYQDKVQVFSRGKSSLLWPIKKGETIPPDNEIFIRVRE